MIEALLCVVFASPLILLLFFFFFNDTATTEIYTLSLHDALPIWLFAPIRGCCCGTRTSARSGSTGDRKSTRLNSSHSQISYAVFCLKKKKKKNNKPCIYRLHNSHTHACDMTRSSHTRADSLTTYC